MKKLMKSLMLFAAAAMALTSCENEAMNEGIEANDTYTMTFVAGAPESKTSVSIDGNTATFSWATEGETFTFVQNTADGLKKGSNVTFNNNDGLAEITATFTEATSPIAAIYPADAYVSNNDNYNKIKLIVNTDQDILDGTFDPAADLMVSKEVTPENATDTHLLQFTRLVAVGKMTIKNLPVVGSEIIEKVNFSINSESALTGRLYIDLATAEVSEWGYYNNAFNEVNLKNGSVAAASENDFYFTCMPATVAAGEIFTVVVTTDVATYTHSVTIPEGKSINFTSGRVSAFGVNMASATRVNNTGIALPWSEGFDSEDLSKYDIVSGSSTTKVYPDDNLAFGASAGEILIGQDGGSMTATLASDGTAKTLNLWFKSNKDFITASSATEGVTVTKLSNYGYTVALAEGVELFDLTLANNGTSGNARVDDIVLTEEAPVVEKLTVEGATLSFTAGDDFATGEDFTVTAVYQNGVTEIVTANVDSSAVNMNTAGTYTVTVSYEGVTATYDVTVQAAGVQTKTIELGSGTYANSTITWTQDGVTVVQAKGNASSAVNSSFATASTMRLYQGHTLTFSCDTNITKIEMVTKSSNYGKTATVDVGTLTNPKTNDCTITWTGSAKKIVLTNGTGSGGSQIQTSSIKITIEVTGSGSEEPTVVAPTITINDITDVPAAGVTANETVGLGSPVGDWTYTVSSDATWLSALSLSDGKVYYTAAANTDAERTATVTITAKCTGQTDVTKTFTVTQAAGESTDGDGDESEETTTWTRVTDVNTLLAGGTFIIGYEASANSGIIVPLRSGEAGAKTTANGYFYSGTTSGSSTSSTINMTSVSDTSAYEVTISASTTVSGAINIQMSTGNYYGTNNSKNTGRLYASPSANTAYVPTLGTNDVVTLKCNAAESYHTLQYNTSSPRFANYNGGQKNVVIYKKN